MAFVRTDIPVDLRRANFVNVLEWLKGLSGKSDVPLQETCILTLCRLAMCVHARVIDWILRLINCSLKGLE